MATSAKGKNNTIMVSVISARTNLGKLLKRVDGERRSLVIEKRGTPRAVLLSLRDYVKLTAPEPEVLKILGANSKQNGMNTIASRQIDQIIQATRKLKKMR